MKSYVTPAPYVFYTEAGEIVSAGVEGISFITDRMAASERVLFGETSAAGVMRGDPAHYVDIGTRQLRERTACPAALDGRTLTGLPAPCRIEITAPGSAPVVYPWDEPALTLSFEHPGRYTVRVLSVPHRPGVFEVQHDG